MALSDLFAGFRTPAATTQAPAPTPATPGNIPPDAMAQLATMFNSTTAPNGAIPATADTANTPVSPLDPFKDLWKDDPTVKPAAEPLFNLNHEALMKAARTQDFRGSATKEQLAAIVKGGPEAMESLLNILNTTGQDIYARSAGATTKLIEAALAKNNPQLEAKFGNQIRSQNVSEGLRTENPALSHPAVQPMISAMESKMLEKFPNATAAEIRGMAMQYVDGFVTHMTKPVATSSAKNPTGDATDWDSFLS